MNSTNISRNSEVFFSLADAAGANGKRRGPAPIPEGMSTTALAVGMLRDVRAKKKCGLGPELTTGGVGRVVDSQISRGAVASAPSYTYMVIEKYSYGLYGYCI